MAPTTLANRYALAGSGNHALALERRRSGLALIVPVSLTTICAFSVPRLTTPERADHGESARLSSATAASGGYIAFALGAGHGARSVLVCVGKSASCAGIGIIFAPAALRAIARCAGHIPSLGIDRPTAVAISLSRQGRIVSCVNYADFTYYIIVVVI
jgi:hypothetical protein